MWTGRIVAALMAPLIALGAAGGVAAQRADTQPNAFARELLSQHNRARDEVGVPRLTWSSKLAGEA